jgi:hypothetical protein
LMRICRSRVIAGGKILLGKGKPCVFWRRSTAPVSDEVTSRGARGA